MIYDFALYKNYFLRCLNDVIMLLSGRLSDYLIL